MIDVEAAESLKALVTDIGSVEEALKATAAESLGAFLSTIAQGEMLAEALGAEGVGFIAEQIDVQLQAQAMALIFAGAFFQESFPDEMAAYFQRVSAEAEAAEAL